MQLKECYELFGGNFEAVKNRIPKEEIIKKFLIKFLSEPSYDLLYNSLRENKYEDAFRAVHSLKGVSANLGFDRLEASTSELTEYLRGKDKQRIEKQQCNIYFNQITKDYNKVVESIRLLDEL